MKRNYSTEFPTNYNNKAKAEVGGDGVKEKRKKEIEKKRKNIRRTKKDLIKYREGFK